MFETQSRSKDAGSFLIRLKASLQASARALSDLLKTLKSIFGGSKPESTSVVILHLFGSATSELLCLPVSAVGDANGAFVSTLDGGTQAAEAVPPLLMQLEGESGLMG